MTDAVHPGSPGAATHVGAAEPVRLLPTPTSRGVAVALAMLTVLHLVAQVAEAPDLARVTQWGLMPLLAAVLWCASAAPRPRLVRAVLVTLCFSWVGDTAPAFFSGDAAFLAMVAGFLVAQVAYAAAFWPYRSQSLARRPAALAAYGLVAVAIVGACAPGAPGPLLAAVVVYALCLGTMAVLATGVHLLAGIGGVVFLVSDAMIGLGAFTDWFAPPASGLWVMLTYVAGQALIVAGVLARRD